MKLTENKDIKSRPYSSFDGVESIQRYLNEKYNVKPGTNVLVDEADSGTEADSEADDTVENSKKNNKNKARDLKEEWPVSYASLDSYTNIFKHIIMFTNNTHPENNKTLNILGQAINNLKTKGEEDAVIPKVHVFLSESVDFSRDPESDEISIFDGHDSLQVVPSDMNNTNTVVIARLGVQGEDNCESVCELLQDRGFLVLNPVRYAAVACNKYETAMLLKKAGIPQPNFTLMTKNILYDKKSFDRHMKRVYKEWDASTDKGPDNNEKLDFVVKILDGHGGTGVMLLNGKRMIAVLQAIFAIDEDRQLIIQRKEEADGGDIRVHVLTLRNKQVILGAMKRVKLSGDFRSNVSLGAAAEPIKLTPAQEQIAVKAAWVSKLPWCAVDIMPIVKGTNKELGDNAVLELNASPGTGGISSVLKDNFMNIMLTELSDPKEFTLQEKTAGYLEAISVDFGKGPIEMLAKLDTGNSSKASCVEVGQLSVDEESKKISFEFDGKRYNMDIVDVSKAVHGDGDDRLATERNVVKAKEVRLGDRVVKDVNIAVIEKRGKSSNALLNRKMMTYMGYTVSPEHTHLLTEEMQKLKIL